MQDEQLSEIVTPQDLQHARKQLPSVPNGKTSKAEFVYKYLKEGIVSGVWHPGDRINDLELSRHLGVSRLSVREALSRLIQDNIVTQVPWKGYSLRMVSVEEIRSFVEVRTVLEQLALRDIFRKNSSKEVSLLAGDMDRVISLAKETLGSGDQSKYMEVDFRFHELLYAASGNLWIAKVIGDTRVFTNILRNVSMGVDHKQFVAAATQSIQDHRDILDAVRIGDEQGAHRLMDLHLMERFTANILRNSGQS